MHIELPSDRLPNWPGHDLRCSECDNDGVVDVPVPPWPGRDGTAKAPCSDCARGYRIEFAVGVKKNGRDEVIDPWWGDQRGGPWGRDGYWQGRYGEGVPPDTRV